MAGLLHLVDDGPFAPWRATLFRAAVIAAVLTATAAAVLATLPAVHAGFARELAALEVVLALVFLSDFLLRLAAARARGGGEAMLRYVLSPAGLVDILAFAPFVFAAWLSDDALTLFGVLRFLKLARYSSAVETLGAVVRREAGPLQAAALIMAILALGAATTLYFVERGRPDGAFDSIPQAMWWAVVTLVTLGYGDVVPVSPLGKLFGAAVALLGLGMFALPASILATGFAEEMRRRHFLLTWHMVARVPLFESLDARQIAEIAEVLRMRRAVPGEVLIRAGEAGDCMYFIAAGRVEVAAGRKRVMLDEGDFFGEIALVSDSKRTATVRARSGCQLLVLDVRDFRKVMESNPELRDKVTDTAARRMNHHREPHRETERERV